MFWNKKTTDKNLDSTMIELGREIERGLVLYYALVNNHWDDMEGNAYHQKINLMMENILKNKTLTDRQRIDEANTILQFSKRYRDQVNKVASNYAKFVEVRLAQFEEMLEPLLKVKPHEKEKEWIKLSKEILKIRESQVVAVNNHIDTDDFIPNLVIQDEGKSDHQMTEEENNYFAAKLGTYGALRKGSYESEKKIEPHRTDVAESLFGSFSDYMKDGSYSRLLNEMRN
jgi:hypothetical protein